MSKISVTIISLLFLVFSVLISTDARSARPEENARASGVKTCADAIARETEPFLGGDIPHVSHDFVAPDSKNIDKRPFYSVAFKSYTDVGPAHINVVATRSDVGRRTRKCDVHLTETFVSTAKTCEQWSGELFEKDFEAVPLASDVTLMQNKGTIEIFSFYYLTSVSQGKGCLVSRRRMAYEP